MATTAPMKVKPHQLHNFPVSLKWGQTTTLAAATAAAATATVTAATAVAADSETESEPEPRSRSRSTRHHRYSFTLLKNNNPTKAPVIEPSRAREKEHEHHQLEQQPVEKEENNGNNNIRPWKLRPRKEPVVAMNPELQREKENQYQQPKSARLRGMVEGGSSNGGAGEGEGGPVEKKRKFWIALSKEEIEEDVFIMTGSRPARRPRKRPKNVQKVLDSVFPGLWLVGTTVDSYRVAESPIKG